MINFERTVKDKFNVAKYDESYLNKLIKEKEVIKEKVVADKKRMDLKKDSVNLRYSSPQKSKSREQF